MRRIITGLFLASAIVAGSVNTVAAQEVPSASFKERLRGPGCVNLRLYQINLIYTELWAIELEEKRPARIVLAALNPQYAPHALEIEMELKRIKAELPRLKARAKELDASIGTRC